MSSFMNPNLEKNLQQVKKAACKLALLDIKKRNQFLKNLAQELLQKTQEIIKVNQKDIAKMNPQDPMIDRLRLTSARIKTMASDLKTVASSPDPLGEIIEQRILENGLKLTKIRVALGAIAVIYESRPNVTVDVAGLCVKSGNAAVLKGGKESDETNKFLVKIIKDCLKKSGLPENCVTYIDAEHKNYVQEILQANKYLELIIPRGGQGLIKFVRDNSTVPVIETGAGVCHTYIDKDADIKTGIKIAYNAKTSRPSVCNALDALLIQQKIAEPTLKEFYKIFKKSRVLVYADSQAYNILKKLGYAELEPALKKHFGQEFLSLRMSIKIVKDANEAISHINNFGSGHSEAIITENKKTAQKFLKEVDAACVYVNGSTRFTDGAEFGLGGEIGISTQKLHARGPMGIKELTSYKWLAEGKGQIRV